MIMLHYQSISVVYNSNTIMVQYQIDYSLAILEYYNVIITIHYSLAIFEHFNVLISEHYSLAIFDYYNVIVSNHFSLVVIKYYNVLISTLLIKSIYNISCIKINKLAYLI